MAESENTQITTTETRTPSAFARWTPSLPTTLLNALNPFSNDDSDDVSTDAPPSKRSSLLSTFFPIASSTTPPKPTPIPDDDSVMFAEPGTRSNSDGGSREGSVDESGRRKTKKCSKAKTSYSICHPPPTSTARQRLHRRPRSLMQLHRLSPNARPQPAFEIIPSANFSVKLRKAMTTVFRSKHGLCANDLVVVRAEKYSNSGLDDERDSRDLVALICKGRKEEGGAVGKAKVCLAHSEKEWEVYPTPTGGYEFFATDEHGLGLRVRWVPKKAKDGSKYPADSTDRKFSFSTISPNSRRHPVIATLSRRSLDINDTFKIPEPSAVTPLSTPKLAPTIPDDGLEEEVTSQNICKTDDQLREIITMTAIWVAFKEGWSPFFKSEDRDKDGLALLRSPSTQSSLPSPTKLGTIPSIPTPPGSPSPLPSPVLAQRPSLNSPGSSQRRSGFFGRGNRPSSTSFPEEDADELEQPASPSSDRGKKSGRTRADSASTVLVHRAASNRMKNQQAGWQVEVLSSQQEMRESPSMESPYRSPVQSSSPTIANEHELIARPILPPASMSATSARKATTVATPSPTRRKKSPQESLRRSTVTSEATTSNSAASGKAADPAKAKKGRRSGGWRILLCGSS